jgi:hypothetical protein
MEPLLAVVAVVAVAVVDRMKVVPPVRREEEVVAAEPDLMVVLALKGGCSPPIRGHLEVIRVVRVHLPPVEQGVRLNSTIMHLLDQVVRVVVVALVVDLVPQGLVAVAVAAQPVLILLVNRLLHIQQQGLGKALHLN